jgi:hypothetical protein
MQTAAASMAKRAAASTMMRSGQLLVRASGVISIGVIGGDAVVFLMKTYVDQQNACSIRKANELADRNAERLRKIIAEESRQLMLLRQEADDYAQRVFNYRRPGVARQAASRYDVSFYFKRRDLYRALLDAQRMPRVQAPAAVGAGATRR